MNRRFTVFFLFSLIIVMSPTASAQTSPQLDQFTVTMVDPGWDWDNTIRIEWDFEGVADGDVSLDLFRDDGRYAPYFYELAADLPAKGVIEHERDPFYRQLSYAVRTSDQAVGSCLVDGETCGRATIGRAELCAEERWFFAPTPQDRECPYQSVAAEAIQQEYEYGYVITTCGSEAYRVFKPVFASEQEQLGDIGLPIGEPIHYTTLIQTFSFRSSSQQFSEESVGSYVRMADGRVIKQSAGYFDTINEIAEPITINFDTIEIMDVDGSANSLFPTVDAPLPQPNPCVIIDAQLISTSVETPTAIELNRATAAFNPSHQFITTMLMLLSILAFTVHATHKTN